MTWRCALSDLQRTVHATGLTDNPRAGDSIPPGSAWSRRQGASSSEDYTSPGPRIVDAVSKPLPFCCLPCFAGQSPVLMALRALIHSKEAADLQNNRKVPQGLLLSQIIGRPPWRCALLFSPTVEKSLFYQVNSGDGFAEDCPHHH